MGDEFSRIAQYFAPLSGPEGLGLLDDAALYAPPAGCDLVLTVDQMLESVHFLPGDPPDLIARKLLRRNLSDLAAMGATATGYLLTTALPPGTDESWLEVFARGLAQDQAAYGIRLFGGDSSSALAHISLSATFIGYVEAGKALRRNGARPGDEIWVTGTIGDAALGLQARRGALQDLSGFLTNRSMLPSPRMGLQLAGIATAAVDISDGLVQDLGHICKASGVAATIMAHLVPASAVAAAFGDAMLETRLTGGDDYELLLAVPPGHEAALRAACGDLLVTKIGYFSAGPAPVRVLGADRREIPLTKAGWRHF
ncbi:MAG: thiamine-phosphate kinase [Acidocella sp. 20-57-95]|nr:MAG: thiamine-phosphate kinase [Acidocella sp. 20-57-95]OYV61966.1 MAG: thiamine-phosphate kinase [Acidocella sp. 21-58-7]HQT64472.1 thiamine-phosphate kinase [Acidocella sp.]HQU04141.1 thiamine-phosphate kinase [Acidocella sp.]